MCAHLLAMPNSAYYFNHFAVLPNLAIASLAGNVGEGHQVETTDLILVRRYFKSFLKNYFTRYSPDVVGLSSKTFQCKTFTFPTALK